MNPLGEKIAAEIAIPGAIAFERFMELALYCPNCGYYEREEDNIGTGGDYYTSVSVGRLLGQLLGWQFAEWLGEGETRTPDSRIQTKSKSHVPNSDTQEGVGPCREEREGRVQIVEAGAHQGELARDILRWMQGRRPELFGRLHYWIVEPSERRQGWQRETLGEFEGKVGWVSTLPELTGPSGVAGDPGKPVGVRGVIFSNELLDAMPVRRWGWDARARRWFEWGVTVKEGRFEWVRMESKVQSLRSKVGPGFGAGGGLGQASGLWEILPDGFTIETHEAAAEWWQEAAGVLERGRLVTLDYGLTEEEWFRPERPAGTLRAYRRHQASREVLAHPGEQDLTAHVNFTAIQEAGEALGLKTEVLTTQERFLTGIAAQIWKEPARFGEWTPSTTRQFQTLTHPEHLGRAFRVLVQGRV